MFINIKTISSLFIGKRRFSLAAVKTAMVELQEIEKAINNHTDSFFVALHSDKSVDHVKIAQLTTDYLKPLNDALDHHDSDSFIAQVYELRSLISKRRYLKCNEQIEHHLRDLYEELETVVNRALSKSSIIAEEIMKMMKKGDNNE